jgi:hypothetical protein
MNTLSQISAVAPILKGADHVDVKTVTGQISLREFIARAFSYQPGWMTFLFHVRNGFARLLRLPPDIAIAQHRFGADDVPLTPGQTFAFFTVQAAEDDHYWIGKFEEKHLDGYVVVAAEPVDHDARRLHMMTIVHYNNWAGPVYFNVIRPFHHLIVRVVMNAAVKN